MIDKTPTAPLREFPTDPNNEPVKSINGAVLSIMGSVVTLTATTNRIAWKPDGVRINDPIIAARLRFDLEIARIIRDQLDIQIGLLTKPQSQVN